MLRVRDVNASVAFYKACGMRVLSYRELSSGAATAFIGFGEHRDAEHFALELAAPGRKKLKDAAELDHGSGFKYMVLQSSETAESRDPDGYTVKCQESQDSVGDRFLRLCLRVTNLERSVSFYCDAMGLQPVQTTGTTRCLLRCRRGGAGGTPTALELLEEPGTVKHGTGFDHLAMSTPDVHVAAAALQSAGRDVFLPPTVMFGTNITGVKDPDGYSIYLTEEKGFRER